MATDIPSLPDDSRGENPSLARQGLLSGLVLLACAGALAWNLSRQAVIPRGGWDETTHLQLPAARMLVSLQAGQPGAALDALHDCSQYPFVAPVYLALTQAVFGIGEEVARWSVLGLWIATLAGLIALGSAVQRAGPDPRSGNGASGRGAGYVALLLPVTLAFVSPLGTRYGATLFLEVPVACGLTWALVFWLRRLRAPSLAGDIWAGAWLTLVLFTKFNYGVLLAAGLVLNVALEWALDRRTTSRVQAIRRVWALALVPALACAWWFVAPFPDGMARAAEHRAAFWDYLFAERGTEATPWARRTVDWVTGVAPNPIVLALTLVGVLASLGQLGRAPVRVLWCVLLACGPAVWFHPFHLDRFLLPAGIVLWVTSGVGWYAIARGLDPWRDRQRSMAGLLLVPVAWVAVASYSALDAAESLGLLSDEPELRAYQESVLEDLGWAGAIPSAGLQPAEHAQLIDWIDTELGPDEGFAWIGMTSELSPASIHLELLARGADRGRFLREVQRQIDITPVPGMPDPGWDLKRFRAFVRPFDVVFVSSPPDLKGRADVRLLESRYQRPLVDELGYTVEALGELDIVAPPGSPVHAKLYALRRQP